MDVRLLQRQWVDHISALFREGFLDAQFTQLQQLQDASTPDFVVEVVTLYFEDADRLLNNLWNTLSQPVVDFKKVDAQVHQLKGSSASIGAQRVKNTCVCFINCCEEGDLEACFGCLHRLKLEFTQWKSKLEALFRIEQQIVAAGGSLPMI
ncbi:Histidine-containing phosphotransfer protein 1 [Platanthera zijinensis]|uniref:Histidine-containing phosphotransfer protein n=1 Tax=Platanthera zijinensis TaxID=2320716 RepID=A0AAP0BQV3_9ASPA